MAIEELADLMNDIAGNNPSGTTPSSAVFACEMSRLSEESQLRAACALGTTGADGSTIL